MSALPLNEQVLLDALKTGVKAEESAKEAHERLDRHDDHFRDMSGKIDVLVSTVGDVRITVSKLGVKVALIVACAGIVAGVVGALVSTLVLGGGFHHS